MYNPNEIYNTYSKKIFNLAYRMTGSKDDADDITQLTFIQAFKSIGKFKGDSHIYTWLYRIAKNNSLRYLDKKKKSSFLSLQGLIDKACSPISSDISESDKSLYISQVKDGCLSGVLRCLSLQQRLAFILNVLLELPIENVAAIIGKSENAVRILVHRSKQNIKNFVCNNCSLYNSKNKCRCENLVNFSLKHGWIGKGTSSHYEPAHIENEIGELKTIVSLYKSLNDEMPSQTVNRNIRKFLFENKNLSILNNKKVK